MNKKDLIIISVLANLGVLAILFMLASRADDDSSPQNEEMTYFIQDMSIEPELTPNTNQNKTESDGMELLLSKNSPTENSHEFVIEEEIPLLDQENVSAESTESQGENNTSNPEAFTEVTVKRGDALEKIARAYGTTVQAIMKANNLSNDRLKIGQVLRIPEGDSKEEVASTRQETPEISTEKFYTLKNGDNPWKIAKKFNLKVDDLLKMNNLNEEKARNLKPGDQIQIKK